MGHSFHFMSTDGLPVQFPDQALREADLAAWEVANDRYWQATPEARGSYHCSYSWSAQIAQALAATGVLVEVEHGPWPRDCWHETPDGEQEPTEEGRAFLCRGVGRPFRVPSFKFSSSDGWIFTPPECQWMAYALYTHPDANMQAFGRFCAVAAQHGGFTAD